MVHFPSTMDIKNRNSYEIYNRIEWILLFLNKSSLAIHRISLCYNAYSSDKDKEGKISESELISNDTG